MSIPGTPQVHDAVAYVQTWFDSYNQVEWVSFCRILTSRFKLTSEGWDYVGGLVSAAVTRLPTPAVDTLYSDGEDWVSSQEGLSMVSPVAWLPPVWVPGDLTLAAAPTAHFTIGLTSAAAFNRVALGTHTVASEKSVADLPSWMVAPDPWMHILTAGLAMAAGSGQFFRGIGQSIETWNAARVGGGTTSMAELYKEMFIHDFQKTGDQLVPTPDPGAVLLQNCLCNTLIPLVASPYTKQTLAAVMMPPQSPFPSCWQRTNLPAWVEYTGIIPQPMIDVLSNMLLASPDKLIAPPPSGYASTGFCKMHVDSGAYSAPLTLTTTWTPYGTTASLMQISPDDIELTTSENERLNIIMIRRSRAIQNGDMDIVFLTDGLVPRLPMSMLRVFQRAILSVFGAMYDWNDDYTELTCCIPVMDVTGRRITLRIQQADFQMATLLQLGRIPTLLPRWLVSDSELPATFIRTTNVAAAARSSLARLAGVSASVSAPPGAATPAGAMAADPVPEGDQRNG